MFSRGGSGTLVAVGTEKRLRIKSRGPHMTEVPDHTVSSSLMIEMRVTLFRLFAPCEYEWQESNTWWQSISGTADPQEKLVLRWRSRAFYWKAWYIFHRRSSKLLVNLWGKVLPCWSGLLLGRKSRLEGPGDMFEGHQLETSKGERTGTSYYGNGFNGVIVSLILWKPKWQFHWGRRRLFFWCDYWARTNWILC